MPSHPPNSQWRSVWKWRPPLLCPASLLAFQFTRPRGARLAARLFRFLAAHVSIHAPARGATPSAPNGRCRRMCFNSRAREGRDLRRTVLMAHGHLFQFTRPHGARRLGALRLGVGLHVSIHAPAWGATPSTCTRAATPWCFNSRARMGRDANGWSRPCASSRRFNSRARMGRDAHSVSSARRP